MLPLCLGFTTSCATDKQDPSQSRPLPVEPILPGAEHYPHLGQLPWVAPGGAVPRAGAVPWGGAISREETPMPVAWLRALSSPRLSLLLLSLSCLRCFFSLLLICLRLFESSLSGRGRKTEPPPTRQWRMYQVLWLRKDGVDKRTVTCGTGLGSWVLVVGWRPLLESFSKRRFFAMSAYHLQNMSLIKNNFTSVMNHKSVIPVNPLLELVMIKARKVLITVWII